MKCDCCQVTLSDVEATLKHPETGAYLDMCFDCLAIADIVPMRDLKKQAQIKEDQLKELNLVDSDKDES